LAQKGVNLFTGKLNRVPGYEEYSNTLEPDLGVMANEFNYGAPKGKVFTPEDSERIRAYQAFNSARSDEAKMDLMRIFAPETAKTMAQDPFGNNYVVKGDKKYYLNMPGVSTQDFKELGEQALGTPEAVGGMAAMALTGPSGKVGTSLLTRILAG